MTKMKKLNFQTLGKKAILFFAFLFGALFSFAQNPITTQPTNEVGCTQGGSFVATYSIATSISGATSIVYAWQADTGTGYAAVPAASPFGGVNGPVMTIANPDGCSGSYTKDSTKFRCAVIVSGGPNAGVWYSNSALLVLFAPVETSDFTTKYGTYTSSPANDTACEGGSTYYVVDNLATTDLCVGIKVVDYRWQKKLFGGSWTNIPLTNPTADTDSLVISNLLLTDDVSQYRCQITSDGCTDVFNSDTVTLMVDPMPEADFSDSDNTLYVCEGDSFTVNIDILNSALSANRGSSSTDWEIYFDTTGMGGFSVGYTDGDGDLDSLDGTGNGTPGITFGHGGISAHGTYILKIDSMINSSSSLRCLNDAATFLTIHVYPRPIATINSAATPNDICEGDTVCFTVNVTNAVFNGSGLDWVLYVTDPYGTMDSTGFKVFGNGNSSDVYCTNPGILTDSFRISLDSIKLRGATEIANMGGGDSCMGTIAPLDTLDIRIVPTPNALLGNLGSGAFTTGSVSGGPHTGSSFKNITSIVATTIDSFTGTGSAGTIAVYYKTGTYVGSINSAGAWTLAGSIAHGGGSYTIPASISMSAGATYGIHTVWDPSVNHPERWGSIVGNTDGNMSITASALYHVGNASSPFANSSADNTWGIIQTVHYSDFASFAGDTIRVCLNDSIPFKFRVFNTTYEGLESDWALKLTDPSGSVTYTNIHTGTGDSVYSDTIWTTGLTPGTYTYSLNSVNLTSTADIPNLGCERIIPNQSFVFEVYPRPDVQFSHDTFNLCAGSSDVFDIEVTNAQFDGNGVPWRLVYSDTSVLQILPASADTGTGNITPSYQFPNDMAVGSYMITLDSIATDWNQNGILDGNDCYGGSNCFDACEIADTLIINVLPRPTIDLVANNLDGTAVSVSNDTIRHCEGDSVEFVITIDSADWKGIPLAWTINLVDGTGVFSSPMTGYGDTVIRDTTSAGLADGRYVISISTVQIDTLGQTCSRVISDETITLEIYSNPTVTFAVDTLTICEHETDNWDIIVGDAMFEGAGQAWGVYFRDTSGLIWSGSPYQDTGNLTPTFSLPSNLPVGQYAIILDSIVKEAINPRCLGSVGAIDTLIVNVYPKPYVTLTPDDTVEVCEGIDTSFTITVTNTSYQRLAGDSVNWSLDFSDNTGSTLGASPLTGHGDTVATYTISNSLAPGYHSIILTNITTDSGCVRAINDTLTIFVKRLPSLTILDVIEPICDGDSLRVNFRVDSGFLSHNWTFDYTLVPNYSVNLPGTVSDTFDVNGSFVGQFTVADTITRGPFSRLLDFGPVTNLTTGCTEIDSVPDSTFYVHPLPAVDITGAPTVCSGQFDPLTGTPVTGWEASQDFDAVVSGTTVGSLDKNWTMYWHVNGPNGSSTTHTTTGTGDNAGIPYDITVPDSLYYHFDSAGTAATFELVVDSIKISGTFANCVNLDPQDSTDFTVNPNPMITFDVPDSLCLGTILSFDRTVMGVKTADDWRFTYAWDLIANDPTPYFGPLNVDGTDTGTANVISNYPIFPGMYSIWTDTLWNKTTNCYSKPEILDSFRMDPPTQPDTLYGDVTVCEDTNSGYLWLDGYVGHILRWEVSHFGSGSWGTWETVSVAGNSPENRPVTFSTLYDTMWFNNKTYSTRYRALVKSGACDSAYSNIVQVFVNPQPAATMLTLTDMMCLGDTANGTFSVNGVPTSNFWTVYWSSTNPTASGSFTGKGSGVFPFTVANLVGFNSVVTLDSIVNTNTSCINTELNTNTQTVIVNGLASAGTLNENTVVCYGTNETTLTLTGFTGMVTKWQSSNNGGATWVDIATTDSTYTAKDLTDTTMYRVIVNSGSCSFDTSNVVTISVLELPNATIAGSDTICPGTTLGLTVTVSNSYGKPWTLTYLEGSLTYTMTGTGDGPVTLTTGSIYSTTDVTLKSIGTGGAGTTCYNDQLDNPGTATVTIVDQATATLASAPDSICDGSSATVNLTVSNVLSTDSVQVDYSVNGTPQSPLMFYGPGSHSFTISSSVLVATSAPSTNYWVRLDTVTNTTSTAVCAGLVADSLLIRVDTASVGGTTDGAVTVCYGNNSGTITLSGNIGSVVYWESSNDMIGWVQINNTTSSQGYANLTDTTWYRAISKNGACGLAYSTATAVTVRELPLATVVGGDTICSGLTDDVTISIVNVAPATTWYIALLEGTRTDTISGTGSSYTYTTSALTSSTDVTLQSIWTGTMSTPDCYNSLNNVATTTVTVLERPLATITSVPGPLCHGSTFTFTVNVSNVATGVPWTLYYSQDASTGTLSGSGSGSFTASSLIGVTANSDLISLTKIEATTGTHTCDSVLSSTKTISVDPTTVAGTIGTNDTVCIGGSGAMSQLATGTGSIVKWQSKIGSGGTWVDINNTSTSNPYYNLLSETFFRAVYQAGVCATANSNEVVAVPKDLPMATLANATGDDTICAGATADFVLTVTNVDLGHTFTVDYLEGSTLKSTVTMTQNASGLHTITTSALTTTTTIQLRKITAQRASSLQCAQNLSGTITVEVEENPTATITTVPTVLCHADAFTFTFAVSSVETGDAWTLTYTQDATTHTTSGSGPGTFTITTSQAVTSTSETIALVSIVNNGSSDACSSTLSDSKTVTINPTTVAGVIGANDTVCIGGSGTMSQISGGTGSIVKWQSKIGSGGTWVDINNTSTSNPWYNLLSETYFRAVYQSGVCATDNSNEVIAVPKELPMATLANATGDDTICSGSTADFVLTVTNVDLGHVFTVDYLEGSTLKSTPTMTQNASGLHTITTSALTTTTTIQLRKITAQRASTLACERNLSGTITVEVEENPNATLTTVPTILCHGESFTFTFAVSDVATGDAWTLIYAQDGVNFSTTGTGPGTFTITTSKTVTSTVETIALVSITNNSTSDDCVSSLTESQTITIDATTVAGVIGADVTVCIGGNGTMTQVSAGVGSIVKWQYRVKGATTWTDINHVFTSYQFFNLQDTTDFRAIYKNNTCSEAASNSVRATPKPLPVATIATQAATDTICAGTKATLSVTVFNVDAGDSVVITYLEGSVSKSIGYRLTSTPQTFDLETGALTTTSDVVLQTIQNVDPLAGQPMCSNTMNNTAKATITVIELPFATITVAPDTICQGDYIPFTVNISNVATTDFWALTYQLEGDIDTITGTGPGSFTHVDTDPNTASSALIALDTIYNLSNIGICKSSKTDDWALHIWEPTVAGTIEAADTICKGGDSKVNEISGTVKTGTIIGWEYRPSSTNAWTEIPNDATTLDVLNLIETTTYRAVYKNGTCDTMHSNYITIDVRELPVATISGSATVCEGDSTNLTVTITNVGSLQDWEVDYLEGVTSLMMTGTGNGTFTLRVGNFNTTTDVTLTEIRTVSLTPQCTNDKLVNNATATVAVNQRPYASLNSVSSPVCQGSTSSFDMTVSNVRSGENWTVTYDVDDAVFGATYSGAGPGTFTVATPALVTAKTYTVNLNLIVNTTTTCDSTLSGSMGIVVDATTDPGTVAADTTVCYAANSGTVTQTGGNGTIIRWEYSENAGASWTTISSTSSTISFSNLTKTTQFRAVKQNGVCTEATQSTPVTVTVRELPVASISGSDTICANTTGTVTVSIVNSYGEDWSVEYLVGTVIDTLNVSGPLTTGTITTPVLNSNTDVTLRKVWLTSGIAQCVNSNLGTNAKATVEVNELPTVTLIQLEDTVCFGSTAAGKVSVDNVRSTESWTVFWSINGGFADSVTGVGPGSFNFTTVALTANPSVVRLVRINNNTTGCAFLPVDEDTVFVSPTTNGGTLAGVDTVCKGSNTGVLTLGADAIGDVVDWEYSEDNGATWTNINSTATTYTYTNLTTTTLFRVLVQSGVCLEEYSSTIEIVVNELPIVEITGVGTSSLCAGSSTYVLITVSNVSSAQSWEITYTEGSATKTKTGTGPGSDTIFTGALSVKTAITLQKIRITSGAPTCENNNLNTRHITTIKVVDNPLATITAYPSDVCSGTNPEITVLVSKVLSTESWTLIYKVNNGSNKSTTGIGSGQFTFNIGALTTVGPNGVRLVSITNTGSSPNCTSALSDTATINVDPTSVAGAVSGTNEVCKGSGGTLTVSGHTGSVVKWQYSTDGITYYDIANTSTTHNFSNLNVKTWFRVVVKSGVCPVDVSTAYVVDIQELPTVTIANPTQTICDGSSTTLSLVIGNLTSTDTWTITYKENGTTKTVTGTGTTGTISLGPLSSTTDVNIIGIVQTNGLACANTLNEKATITVLENPTATINIVPDSLCEGDILTFSVVVDDVTATTGWELDYTIDGVAAATVTGTGSGSFTINTSRAVSPSQAVIVLTSIELTSTPFCSSTLSDTDSLVVSPTTVGGTVTPASSTICEGDNVTLTLSGETGDIQNWEYSTDGGSTWSVLSNMTNVLNANNVMVTTLYRVYVQSGTCSGMYSTTATVTVIPSPDATVSSSDVVCPNELATFTLHVSDVPAGNGWSVVYRRNGALVGTPVTGTGSGDFDFSVTGSSYNGNPTYITVELVSITNTTHGCVNAALTSTASARVTPNPVAAFTADNACEDSVVVFNNRSSIAEGALASFKWYFGDGDSSLANSPTHKYAGPGTYTVRLVAVSDNGCTGEISKTVTVYDDPIAAFTTANVCKNADLVLTDGSSVANGTITGWFWEFGDGTTSSAQNPTHRYAAAGNYDVTLTVTTNNGCSSSITREVTIYVLPEANFVATPVCENNAMKFINTSAIGYGTMNWDWNFANQGTSTAKDPSFTFAGFGQFDVELVATSNFGCKDTINRQVTVHPEPTASFTVDPVCIGEESQFVNTSSVATGALVEYFWDFGDTTFSGLKDPSHTYAEPNVAGYPVTLRIKTDQGCEDEVAGVAVVQPLPDVQLTANGATEFCFGDSVNLSANANARTYEWTYSDGSSTSGVDNIWASKTGWHKVRITAPPIGCANEDSIYITVWPLPDAKAWPADKVDQSIDTIHLGESLQLHASGGEIYDWNPVTFLDNSGVADPVAQRVDADITYIVTVTDTNGCINTATVSIDVLNDFHLVVYNVITPNDDGYNDTWIIDNIWAYPNAEVIIFNRYGMEVFRGTNYANDWDGTYNDKDLPDGAYYYVVLSPDHKDIIYKGAINLIRNR
jgi:gliding motility-associated-like protein